MDKLINSQQEPQVLKICYGNDFMLSVSVNVWNADTSAWDKMDLSAAQDVELFLVAQNGKRIKTNTTLDESGDLTTQVPSTFLSKTIYSIEITFKLDGRNRRTYSPCLIQIVNSTEEAGQSVQEYVTNDAYHFDIMVKNDIAWLNVGSLPSGYVTEDELATVLTSYITSDELTSTLTSYATNSSVENQINLLWQDANNTFVDNDELSTTLSSYVTSKDLATASYATNSSVETQINLLWQDANSTFIDNDELSTALSSYTTYAYINERLGNIDLPTNVVTSYDGTYVYCLTQQQYDSISNPDPNVFYYITDSSTNYVTRNELSSYVSSEALSQMGYVTSTELTNAGYVTNDALSQMGYITLEDIPEVDLSSYVKKTTLDDTLTSYVTFSDVNDMSYVTYTYLDERLADLPSGDVDLSAYVTYTYWDSSNEAVAYFITSQTLFNNDVYSKNEVNTMMSSYAKQSDITSTLSDYVTIVDNEQQNEVIAYAISYLNDLISQINNSI